MTTVRAPRRPTVRASTSAQRAAHGSPADRVSLEGPERHEVTDRYSQRRDDIIAAATMVFNQRGIKGASLREIAQRLHQTTTSINYYFPTKDALAAECLMRSIDMLASVARQADRLPDPRQRIAALVYGYVDVMRRVRHGHHPPVLVLSEVLSIPAPHAEAVRKRYREMYRSIRSLLTPVTPGLSGSPALNARAHLLLSILLWMTAWLHRFEDEALAHVAETVTDLLIHGLAEKPLRPTWPQVPRRIPKPLMDAEPRLRFLRAATRLINQFGYRGASIDRISAELNLTKGAFYHHLEAKSDVVLECFRRTFAVMTLHLDAALRPRTTGTGARRLYEFCAGLVRVQLSPDDVLLRTSALQAVPPEIRSELLAGFKAFSLGLGRLIEDGIADGSLRRTDPEIAAELVSAMINSASELGRWTPDPDGTMVSRDFIRPLFNGIVEFRSALASPPARRDRSAGVSTREDPSQTPSHRDTGSSK